MKKIGTRILLGELLLCGVLIVVIGALNYREEKQIMAMETEYYIEETSSTKEQLNILFDMVEQYALEIKKQCNPESFLSLPEQARPENREIAEQEIDSLVTLNANISRICMLGVNEYVYSSGGAQENTGDLRFYQRYLEEYAAGNDRQGCWTKLHMQENDSFSRVITYISPVFDTQTRQLYGIVAIDLTYESIQKIFTSSSIRLRDKAVIVDDAGNVILQYPLIASYTSILTQYPEIRQGNTQIKGVWNKKNVIIVSQRINAADWNVVRFVPLDEATKRVKAMFAPFSILILCLMVFCVLYSVLVTNSITHPIKDLSTVCDRISRGEFSVKANLKCNNEIGYFAATFDNMMDRINALFAQTREEQRRKSELEYKILMAQVNPHFLYNTLDTIRWLAVMQQVPNIAQLTVALINLLKYNLGKTARAITLQEEVESVKHYVTIQKFRQTNNFDFTTDMDEEALNCPVIQFILQPLVENSILHGFQNEDRSDYQIHIFARVEAGYLRIQVIDNGAGFDVSEGKPPNTRPDKTVHFNKIGVNSTRERLRLHYGDTSSLTFTSIRNCKTTAEIILPVEQPGKP